MSWLVAVPANGAAAPLPGYDWSTYGFDDARSGENVLETSLGTANAAGLHSLWSFDLGAVTISQPVLASGVVVNSAVRNILYIGTEHGDFYALDADSGAVVWQRNLGSVQTTCHDTPDTVFGIGGAAVIDHSVGVVYVAGGDGGVYGLDMVSGTSKTGWPVKKTFTAAQEHVYGGLTIAGGQLYVTVASHCDISPYHGRVIDIDIATHRIVKRFYPAGTTVDGGGIWGPGGVSVDTVNGHVFAATGNAKTTPETYRYSDSVVELTNALSVVGHQALATRFDRDYGATPILYQAPGCPAQLAAKNKSGILVVYTRGSVSAGYTQRLQIASIKDGQFNGIPAYSSQTQMLYLSNSSDSNVGTYKHGMVALKVQPDCSLRLAWQVTVGPNFSSVSPPTVANGVVYYGDGPGDQLLAFDAATGAQLWNSGTTIAGPVFATPMVANGKLYAGSWDHKLYAFGP
jgi:outer membrane protein assembly factor BamB